MKKIIIKILCLVAFLYTNHLCADLHNANEIYQANFTSAKNGCHVKNDILFVVVDLKFESQNIRNLRMKAMIQCNKLLRSYCNYRQTRLVSPFVNKLTAELNVKANHSYSFSIKAPSRILVNRKISNKHYRYVTAFNKKDVDALKKPKLPAKEQLYPLSFWVKKLQIAFKKAQQYNDIEKINSLYSQLGCIELMISNNAGELAFSVNLQNYPAQKLNLGKTKAQSKPEINTSVIQAIAATVPQKVAGNKINSVSDAIRLLRAQPGHIPALNKLAKLSLEQNKNINALTYAWLSMTENAGSDIIVKSIKRLSPANPSVWKEYSKLIQKLDSSKSDSLLKKTNSQLLSSVYDSFGHVIPANTIKSDKTRLYMLNKKYGKISMQQLFDEVKTYLEECGKDAKAWTLLGNTCYAQKAYIDAIVCYNQAIFIDDSANSSGAVLSAAYCLNKLLLKQLAIANAWGVLLKNSYESTYYKLAEKFLQNNMPKGTFKP